MITHSPQGGRGNLVMVTLEGSKHQWLLLICGSFLCQTCVKERARNSMLCVRNITKKEAEDVIENVFESCFNDTEPFERIPP